MRIGVDTSTVGLIFIADHVSSDNHRQKMNGQQQLHKKKLAEVVVEDCPMPRHQELEKRSKIVACLNLRKL